MAPIFDFEPHGPRTSLRQHAAEMASTRPGEGGLLSKDERPRSFFDYDVTDYQGENVPTLPPYKTPRRTLAAEVFLFGALVLVLLFVIRLGTAALAELLP